MSSIQSYVFDFTRVPKFMDDINREDCFDTADMDGVNNNFEFVFATSCPTNIEDCLTNVGTIDTSKVSLYATGTGLCKLLWSTGVNGNRVMSIANNSVTIDIGDVDVELKAMFLRDARTGYVLAYSINDRAVMVTNQVIFPVDGVLWSYRNEV